LVGYESWVELGQLMRLDCDPGVVAMASQPFRFSWRSGGRARRTSHTPDYFVRRRDGTGVVLDVRPDDRIEPKDAVKFEVTAAACARAGWGFERVGVLDPVLAANLRWLSGYRHPRVRRETVAAELRAAFARPRGLWAGVGAVGDPIAVLPVPFHLLWRRELAVDLEPGLLSAATQVRPVSVAAKRWEGGCRRVRGCCRWVTGSATAGGSTRLPPCTARRCGSSMTPRPPVSCCWDTCWASEGFTVLSTALSRPPLPEAGVLDGLPEKAVQRAEWGSRHLAELLTGRPDRDANGPVRAEYDPAVHWCTLCGSGSWPRWPNCGTAGLRDCGTAGLRDCGTAGLRDYGEAIGLSTLRRMRSRFENEGVAGLVDGRLRKSATGTSRADPRVVETIAKVAGSRMDEPTVSAQMLRRRVERLLAAEHGAGVVRLPSRAAFYRLLEAVSTGQHLFVRPAPAARWARSRSGCSGS
jgi:hypothetical protein